MWLSLLNLRRFIHQMATLEELRLREMEAFSNLRAANESKLLPTADCMDLKVCVCQKAPMGAMLQCELCRDAFHSVCVRDRSDSWETRPWLCPQCHRSEKPPLNKVLGLLASLQHLGVRLPEGDALHFLVERTVSWQQRAQRVLQSYNLELGDRAEAPPTLTRCTSGSLGAQSHSQVGPLLLSLFSPSKGFMCRCSFSGFICRLRV